MRWQEAERFLRRFEHESFGEGGTTVARSRGDRQLGAATLEYVGAVLVVSVLIVGLLVTVPSISEKLTCAISKAAASITGASAGCSSSATEDGKKGPPEGPYVKSSHEQDYSTKVSVLFVDVKGGMKLMREDLSDGTVRISLTNSQEAGVSASSGGIELGDFVSAEAKASGALKGASGLEYSFDSPEAAQDFIEYAQKEFDRAPALSVPVVGFFAGLVFWSTDQFQGYNYEPPPPSAVVFEGGIVGGGEAGASAGFEVFGGADVGVGVEAEVEAGTMLGSRTDMETGETTTYAKVYIKGEADAQVNLGWEGTKNSKGGSAELGLDLNTLGLSGGMEVIVESTRDADGNLVGVGLTTATEYSLPDFSGPTVTSGNGTTAVTSWSIPVDDSNRARAESFALSMVTKPSETLSWAADQISKKGEATMLVYDAATDDPIDFSIAAKLPGIGGFGLEVEQSVKSSSIVEARYLEGDEWVPWKD